MKRFFILSVCAVAFAYGVTLATLFVCQRRLLYFPDGFYVAPSRAYPNSRFQELSVETEDGLALKGWYVPATGQPFTLVFFHGNGDCLVSIAPVAASYTKAGYGFLLAEYRGYSGLPGRPTEKGLYADGRAYLKALIASGVEGKNVILLGYSLGSGVATQMATEFGVGGVILMAPFSSIPDVAKQQFRIFPVKYFALDRFDNTAKISKIRAPLLIVNGGNDGVIPPSQGKQLFDLANEPKQFGFFPAAGHNDLFCGDFETLSLAWLRELNIHANHAASPFALPARG